MGKRIIAQARGRGGPRYRAPSFRYAGEALHKSWSEGTFSGTIREFVHSQGHSAPLARVAYDDGDEVLMPAAEGLAVGDVVRAGTDVPIEIGNSTALKNIPEGAPIYNVEGTPGDGGKYARASGVFAKVLARRDGCVIIKLPSKKNKELSPECRATIGVLAGGGRLEKPFLKAGHKFYKMRARNKLYPRISGGAVNAVDHPFGNKRSSRKSKARPAPRHAPPGRNVGMIRPRRTGRKTGVTVQARQE